MKRILIVGISGMGKSQLARQLASKLDIPLVYLDSIFWKNNWIEEDEVVVEDRIKAAISKDRWIIEGYIEPLGSQRAERADTVIYLDYSGHLAAWGGFQRWMNYKGTNRPEMPRGNTESLGVKFLLTLLRRDERPEIEKVAARFPDKTRRFKGRGELKQFISSL